MNKYLILFQLFLLSLSLTSYAQGSLIKGKVVDQEDGKSLESVICEVWDADNKMLAFAISEQDGSFSVITNEKAERISFRLIAYADKELFIQDIPNPKDLKVGLTKESFQLKEVVVRIPPIKLKGDTITYSVDRFRGQEDRSIADVLKKMPGVKVDDKGAITYQGEAINKFYIEGKDLLGGQYNIATNNLSVDAVSEVEVLENNQHVKALKDLEHSEKAAINLKLKEGYKLKPFGEVELGVGGFPALYDEKLFSTLLTNNIQTIVNIKTNNKGKDLMNDLEEKRDYTALFSHDPLPPDMIILPSHRTLPFSEERYLFNNDFLASINSLVSLDKDTELKANLSYGVSKTEQDWLLNQNYFTGGSNLILEEKSEQERKLHNYRFSFIAEHNSSGKYLKNETIFQRKENRINSNMHLNDKEKDLNQTNRPTYIQNNLNALLKYGANKTVAVNSYLRYLDNREYLFLQNGDDSSMEEQIKGKHLVNKNRISSSFSLAGHRLSLGLSSTYKKKQYETSLYSGEEKNEIDLFQLSFTPNYQIKSGSQWIVTFNLPLTYSHYSVKKDLQKKENEDKILFSPSLSAIYKYNHRWEFYTGLGHTMSYADDNSLLTNPYLQSYRTIYIPSGNFNTSSSYNLTARVNYKDIADMLFFNLMVHCKINNLNYIWNNYNTEEWTYYTTEKKDNTSKQFSITSELSKIFIPYQLSITFNPSYFQVNSEVIQQDILLRTTIRSASLNTKMEWKGLKNTSLSYNLNGTISWNANDLMDTRSLKNLKQRLHLYYFPNKKMDISLSGEHSLYETQADRYVSCFFLDMSLKYRSKQWELGLTASNLLDKSHHSFSTFSSVNTFFQSTPLRGREFFLAVKRSF